MNRLVKKICGWVLCGLLMMLIAGGGPCPSFASELSPISQPEMNRRIWELTPGPWDRQVQTIVSDPSGPCPVTTVIINVADVQKQKAWGISFEVGIPNIKGPNIKGKVPAVVVVPTIDGVTLLERKVVSQLCSAGIASILTNFHDTTQPTQFPAWGYEDEANRREILSLRSVLNFAETMPALDSKKIGMVGLSLGGILTAMMAGLEPDRLKTVVIAVGAGNLPYILAHSQNRHCAALRANRMKAIGAVDENQYEALLSQNFRYDPLFFASRVQRDRVKMVISTADIEVPYEAQRQTFEAFNRPDYTLFNLSHVETLISLVYVYFDPIVQFLKAQFQQF